MHDDVMRHHIDGASGSVLNPNVSPATPLGLPTVTLPAPRSRDWKARVPAQLSPRMRALLVDGTGIERYREGGSDCGSGAGRDTHRVTSAIVFGLVRAGAERLLAQDLLLSSPAAGGSLLRDLARAKGHDHAVKYLGRAWRRAEKVVGTADPITSRQDALVALAERRARIESYAWVGQVGQTDRANLLFRLELCERAGGFDHEVSQRQLALGIGVGDSTAKRSDIRLQTAGWLWQAELGAGGRSTKWVLGSGPKAVAKVVSPDDHTRQGGHKAPGSLDGVIRRQAPAELDFRLLADLSSRDAFRVRGLGKSSLEVLAALAHRDGQTAAELATSTTRHRATVHAKLARLLEHGLVEKVGELYHLAEGALDTPQPVHGSRLPAWRPADGWDDLATRLGTFGASYRQWCAAAFDRIAASDVYRRVREHVRPARPTPVLTVVDEDFLNAWTDRYEYAA